MSQSHAIPPREAAEDEGIRATRSLCPVCLRLVDAAYTRGEAPGEVRLRKTCPEHGVFSVPVWRAGEGEPAFTDWTRPKQPSPPGRPATPVEHGCPFDCGLCPEHGQHTCTGLIEITQRCNMRCPVCFASSGDAPGPDLSVKEVQERLDALFYASGACNVQFSGGEPTLHDALPQLAAYARRKGFGLIQVNSNGLRLGREPGYARALRAAGVDSIYLQWDGVTDVSFRALRGQECLSAKKAALDACAEAGLGVVLVATVVHGVNDGELGGLLHWALRAGPTVRGLHLQPFTAFGRSPWSPEGAPRLTLPELMRRLEAQAPELIRATHFHPPGCEHELCSFSALYRRVPGAAQYADSLEWLPGGAACCGDGNNALQTGAAAKPLGEDGEEAIPTAAEGARKARQFVASHWAAAQEPSSGNDDAPNIGSRELAEDGFSRFLAQAGMERRFTLSAMAFQDALSLDVARVRGCCIHVVGRGGKLIPFCLYNVTSEAGVPLYRGTV